MLCQPKVVEQTDELSMNPQGRSNDNQQDPKFQFKDYGLIV